MRVCRKTPCGLTPYGKPKGRPQGVTNRRTVRVVAIASGLVPKVRKSFCLFTQAEAKKPEYQRARLVDCIKPIAKQWRELDDATKNAYKQQATDEHIKHREATVQHEDSCCTCR